MIVEIGSKFDKGDLVIPWTGLLKYNECTVIRINWNRYVKDFDYEVSNDKGETFWYSEGELEMAK